MRRNILIAGMLVSLLVASGVYRYQHLLCAAEKEYQELLDLKQMQVQRLLYDQAATMQGSLLLLKLRLMDAGVLSPDMPLRRSAIEALFSQGIDEQALISQIRWLDAAGDERARIDRRFVEGAWEISSPKRLQEKSDREYFRRAMGRPVAEIYISELDLNQEEGKLSQPLEPTLRLMINTAQQEGMRPGLLIVNYNFNALFDRLAGFASEWITLQLLDMDGHWFFNSEHPAWSWRQINPRQTLEKTDPAMFRHFQEVAAGSREKLSRNSALLHRFDRLTPFGTRREEWALISFTALTEAGRDQLVLQSLRETLPTHLLVLFIAGALYWWLLRSETEEITARNREYRQLQELQRVASYRNELLEGLHEDMAPLMKRMNSAIERQWSLEPTDAQRRCLEATENCLRELNQVANDILDLGKIEAGRMRLSSDDISLLEIAESCLRAQATAADHQGLELSLLPGTTVYPLLAGDGQRLTRIVNNLLQVVIGSTDSGCVVLALKQLRETPETLSFSVSVSASGLGVNEPLRERLQASSLQAHSEGSEHGTRSLGTVVVNLLLAAMNSRLQFDSGKSYGDCISFELTLDKSGTAPLQPVLDDQSPDCDVALVVGCGGVCRLSLEQLFARWQIIVESLDTLPAVGEFIAKNAEIRGLVLIDHDLLRDRGVQNLRQLAEQANRVRSMRLVIMAPPSQIYNYMNSECRRLGIRVLRKPVLPSELERVCAGEAGAESDTFSEPGSVPEPIRFAGAEHGTTRTRRILLVEDNRMDQMLAREIIERFGIEVDLVENGVEALSALRKRSYQLVLMDLQMPVMDGFETAGRIRKEYPMSELPIFALTAASSSGDMRRAEKAGMNGCLTKPIDVAKLRQALVNLLLDDPLSSPLPGAADSERKSDPAGADADLVERLRHSAHFDLSKSVYATLGESVFIRALQAFQEDMAPHVQEWLEQPEQWSQQRRSRLAHQLKGCAGGIGAMDLEAKAREVNDAIRRGEKGDFMVLMNLLRQVTEAIGPRPEIAAGV